MGPQILVIGAAGRAHPDRDRKQKTGQKTTRLTLEERLAFRFISGERRVARRWYGRFLVFGIGWLEAAR